MVKALRKHQKWILVIGGSLLMIAFLVQGAVSNLAGDPLSRTVATFGGKSMSARSLKTADDEFGLLRSAVPATLRGLLGVEGGYHWFLLSHEAEQAGLVGDVLDGEAAELELANGEALVQLRGRFGEFAGFAAQQPSIFNPILDRTRAEIAAARTNPPGSLGMNPDDAARAFSKLRGVLRLVNSGIPTARLSDARSAVVLRPLLDSVLADVVVVHARDLSTSIGQPLPDALVTHFAQFRGETPEDGAMGIGYVLPPRVKLQWIKLDLASIKQAVRLDPVEVNKAYRQARDRFPGEFAAERPKIEQEMIDARSSRAMSEATRAVRAVIDRATRDATVQNGYKVLPEGWAALKPTPTAIASEIVQAVRLASEIEIPTPSVEVRTTNYLTRADLAALPGIGSASVSLGAKRLPFPDAALSVRDLDPQSTLGLQLGLLSTLHAEDAAGNRYFFEILDARPQSSADTIEEVLDRVTADYKAVRAYEQLRTKADTIRDLARSLGFEPAAQLAVAGSSLTPPAPRAGLSISRDASRNPEPALQSPAFVEAIFDAASKIDPLVPVTDETAGERTIVVTVDKTMSLIIARAVGVKPLTVEQVRALSETQFAALALQGARAGSGATTQAAGSPYSFDALKARWDFKIKGRDEEAPTEGEPAQ